MKKKSFDVDNLFCPFFKGTISYFLLACKGKYGLNFNFEKKKKKLREPYIQTQNWNPSLKTLIRSFKAFGEVKKLSWCRYFLTLSWEIFKFDDFDTYDLTNNQKIASTQTIFLARFLLGTMCGFLLACQGNFQKSLFVLNTVIFSHGNSMWISISKKRNM